jgi:hypothetical protein
MQSDLEIRHSCSFWAQKRGNTPDEFEDAFALDARNGRFAVADGATESSFADLWAKQLVDGFVSRDGFRLLGEFEADVWHSWLPSLQEQWKKIVDEKDLPWFGRNKIEKGAHATFLGLTFQREELAWHRRWLPWFSFYKDAIRWRAIAVGDACMFMIRNDICTQAFPVTRPDDFHNSPCLVASISHLSAALSKNERRCEGECRQGDLFWLMTDALAHWFLKERDADRRPWRQLGTFLEKDATQNHFVEWIEKLRSASEIRNDDVTALGIAF